MLPPRAPGGLLPFMVCLLWLLSLLGAPVSAARHALLVGVTEYPTLRHQTNFPHLAGPLNDVALLRQTLLRSAFPSNQIHILANAPEFTPPTRARILGMLERLAQTVRPGEFCLIYLAGHGSQQPARPNDPEEPDGLDEIFLPTDAGFWTPEGGVANALIDHEIGAALDRIQRRGAFVWFVADACYSGTLTRGQSPGFHTARVLPFSFLTRPGAQPPPALSRATRGGGLTPDTLAPLSSGFPDAGAVYMFACQPHETTIELELPAAGDPVRGLFSFYLVQALEMASSPMTYQTLMEKLHAIYRSRYQRSSMPFLQGTHANSPVLQGRVPWEASIPCRASGRQITVEAGQLHGLASNAVLRLLSPQSSGSLPPLILGYASITECDLASAKARPIAFGGLPAPTSKDLARGFRCAIVDWGQTEPLRLAFHPGPTPLNPRPNQPRPSAAFNKIWRQVQNDPFIKQRVERAASPSSADWVVLSAHETEPSFLAPAAGWHALEQQWALANDSQARTHAPFRLPPLASPGALAGDLSLKLRGIVRAASLLRLAELQLPENRALDFNLDLHLHQAGGAKIPIPFQTGGRLVTRGDRVSISARSLGQTPSRIHLFSIANDYKVEFLGVLELDPARGATEAWSVRLVVQETSMGLEQVAAIAVPRDDASDFTFLTQDLAGRRSAPPNAPPPSPRDLSPAEAWLNRWVDGISTRAGPPGPAPRWLVKTLGYVVTDSPEPRPLKTN